MKLHAEPPIDEWCWPIKSVVAPRIATGHQPWFWHPGILVKYIAAAELARSLDGEAIDVVVDQDTIDSLAIDLPYVVDEQIKVDRLQLAAIKPSVPTGMQSPVSAGDVLASLHGVKPDIQIANGSDLERLAKLERFENAWSLAAKESFASLAEQIRFVLAALMSDVGVQFDRERRATTLLHGNAGQQVIEWMKSDARACVQAYNNAVASTPAAGVTPLSVEPDRVELPLWFLEFNRPRQRVYADLADSTPILVLADGSEIDSNENLAPRALLLTALMRSEYCDLFIHGTGGGVYDAVTDQWWQTWRGELLSPVAVISTDMHLDFDVPLSDREDYLHAIWFAHHLPHNIDRCLPFDEHHAITQQKSDLLLGMSQTADRHRRAELFAKLKQINHTLATKWSSAIQHAKEEVETEQKGMANSRIAQRRDWSVVLHSPTALRELRDHVAKRFAGVSKHQAQRD